LTLCALVVAIGLSAACSDGSSSDDELRVTTYNLGAGETAVFPPGFMIRATEDVVIDGTLLFESDTDKHFQIIAGGDISISGTVAPAGFDASATSSLATTKASVTSCRPVSVSDLAQPGKASSVLLEAVGDIRLHGLATLVGCDGATPPDHGILNADGDRMVGYPGQDGGDIILRATGRVIMEASADLSADPVLYPGDGGHGGNIQAVSPFFPANGTLVFQGADGGDSGNVIIESSSNRLFEASDIGVTVAEIIDPAYGGDGGDVTWDLRAGEDLFEVSRVGMRAGSGGASITYGGNGGNAWYRSGRVMHVEGAAAGPPLVAAHSGSGGDVIPTDLPQLAVAGGDAGSVAVLGNNGRPGEDSPARVNGEDGGAVVVTLAKGGSVQERVDAASATGGNAATESVWSGWLRSQGWAGPAVSSGIGGKGFDGCPSGSSGGDGGDAGTLEVSLGDGGDVPLSITGGVGGDGAQIPGLARGEAGLGGSSDTSPGEGGCAEADGYTLVLGEGGVASSPGSPGIVIGEPATGPATCRPGGAPCGLSEFPSGEQCRTSMAGFTAASTITVTNAEGGLFNESHREFVGSADASSSGKNFHIVETSTFTTANGSETTNLEYDSADLGLTNLTNLFRGLHGPTCFEEGLYFVGDGSHTKTEMFPTGMVITTVSFSGCSPIGIYPEDRPDHEVLCGM